VESNWIHSARRSLIGLLYLPGWLWWWRIRWNEDWQEKPKYPEKIRSSANLSTTNPTWPDPRSNPGRRGRKPATNRLSYGAALSLSNILPDEEMGFSLMNMLHFVKFTYRTCSILLKILPFALYTSRLSVQASQSRPCLSYVSYIKTAASLIEQP
jgi:hypothetical protein